MTPQIANVEVEGTEWNFSMYLSLNWPYTPSSIAIYGIVPSKVSDNPLKMTLDPSYCLIFRRQSKIPLYLNIKYKDIANKA